MTTTNRKNKPYIGCSTQIMPNIDYFKKDLKKKKKSGVSTYRKIKPYTDRA